MVRLKLSIITAVLLLSLFLIPNTASAEIVHEEWYLYDSDYKVVTTANPRALISTIIYTDLDYYYYSYTYHSRVKFEDGHSGCSYYTWDSLYPSQTRLDTRLYVYGEWDPEDFTITAPSGWSKYIYGGSAYARRYTTVYYPDTSETHDWSEVKFEHWGPPSPVMEDVQVETVASYYYSGYPYWASGISEVWQEL